MAKITKKEIEALKATGRVVYVYPRKKLCVVDGFKRFRIA